MESAFIPWKKYLSYSLVAIVALFVYQFISSPMIVTVAGVGEVSAPAKTATLTFAISVNDDNAQSASNKLESSVNKIKETLKTNGIPESDIYEASTSILPAGSIVAGATGFQATANMGIKTTQINNVSIITTSLYSQGATVVTQPTFSVGEKDKVELEKDAYDLAIKDARKQANSLSWRYFKPIKKIVLIQESTTPTTSTVTSKADTVTQIEKKISADTGLIKVSKSLSVSYKMW